MNLADYITSKLNEPFEYGKNDCVLFAIGWVELETGKKYLPKKLWTDEKSAMRTLKRHGDLILIFDKHFPRIPAPFANDGDLTVVDGVAMLFSGRNIVSVGHEGLMHKSRIFAGIAWTYSRGTGHA